MKRFIVLLVLLAGGLVAAAFAVPTNAAVVNGTTVSQQQLNSDVHAIAGSPDYQCYLDSQEYLSSEGSEALPAVTGAGTGQNAGDNPTATSAFVSNYLDTEIGHQIVDQLAAKRGVTVSEAQLTTARKAYESQIDAVMSEVAQTAQGQNPAFSCSTTGQPLTGAEILDTLPASFVDQQVQFLATATQLQEDLSGYGSSDAELERYFQAHLSTFDTACFTVAAFTSESDATAAKASVASGTPFATVASGTQGGGPQGCAVLAEVTASLPSSADLATLPLNTVSDPIVDNGNYLLVEITKRTPTAFSAVKAQVANAVLAAGSTKTQKVVSAAQRHSTISVNPQYGVWVPVPGTILVPLAPPVTDVLNAKANEPAGSTSSPASASASTFSG